MTCSINKYCILSVSVTILAQILTCEVRFQALPRKFAPVACQSKFASADKFERQQKTNGESTMGPPLGSLRRCQGESGGHGSRSTVPKPPPLMLSAPQDVEDGVNNEDEDAAKTKMRTFCPTPGYFSAEDADAVINAEAEISDDKLP